MGPAEWLLPPKLLPPSKAAKVVPTMTISKATTVGPATKNFQFWDLCFIKMKIKGYVFIFVVLLYHTSDIISNRIYGIP